MLAMLADFVSNFVAGPGEPLLQSGISLSMPNFAGVVDVSQVTSYSDIFSVLITDNIILLVLGILHIHQNIRIHSG